MVAGNPQHPLVYRHRACLCLHVELSHVTVLQISLCFALIGHLLQDLGLSYIQDTPTQIP